MKIVLKRRKHRNGIRPKRKGALKMNLQQLPTKEEHRQAVTGLMVYRDKVAPLDMALVHLEAGNKIEFDWIIKASNYFSGIIESMQKGYNYFREYHQADTMNLALKAINDVSPVFVGNRKSACDTCERKTNCPFEAMPYTSLDLICPIRRRAQVERIMKAVRNESTETPLSQSDMANLAVKHLS